LSAFAHRAFTQDERKRYIQKNIAAQIKRRIDYIAAFAVRGHGAKHAGARGASAKKNRGIKTA
jgi:plasmid maintenance system killer protein